MSFQLQDFNSILADMIADMTALNPTITDYTEGSVIRSLLETYAKQIQKLQLFAFDGIREGIKVGTYQNFNFQRLPASYATGLVRFYATSPQSTNQSIAAGTTVQVPGTNLSYVAGTTTTLLAGANYVDVFVTATVLGSAGNTPSNTITQLLNPYVFISNVNNLSPLINGQDQESDSARLARFQNYILSFSRGTTYAIQSAAENVYITDNSGNITEKVAQALVVEGFIQDPTQPLGEIQLYIDNGSGTASSALLELVNETIIGYTNDDGFPQPGYVAAGVELTTLAVIPLTVNIIANIALVPGSNSTTVIANVSAAIAAYMQTLTIGETVQIASLFQACMNTSGVSNITFTQPSSDITINTGYKGELGSVQINVI